MKKISGVGRWYILKNFFKRINEPYDLRIRNAVDGEELLHMALTKKSVFMLISTILVISFVLSSLLFLFTPIKHYIPGFETIDSRKKVVALTNRVDSLEAYQRSAGKMLGSVISAAKNNESVPLDTIALDSKDLNRAEMVNRNEISSKSKGPAVTRKKKIDVIKEHVKINKKPPVEPIEKEPEAPVIKTKKPSTKRDTVIIYK